MFILLKIRFKPKRTSPIYSQVEATNQRKKRQKVQRHPTSPAKTIAQRQRNSLWGKELGEGKCSKQPERYTKLPLDIIAKI
jgi:hypothetical protein